VRLGVSTIPPNQNLIHEFLINMAFTIACPNFKKGLKMAFSPLEVKVVSKKKLTTT
jgi:flagellar biosynthesis protein FliP